MSPLQVNNCVYVALSLNEKSELSLESLAIFFVTQNEEVFFEGSLFLK